MKIFSYVEVAIHRAVSPENSVLQNFADAF